MRGGQHGFISFASIILPIYDLPRLYLPNVVTEVCFGSSLPQPGCSPPRRLIIFPWKADPRELFPTIKSSLLHYILRQCGYSGHSLDHVLPYRNLFYPPPRICLIRQITAASSDWTDPTTLFPRTCSLLDCESTCLQISQARAKAW